MQCSAKTFPATYVYAVNPPYSAARRVRVYHLSDTMDYISCGVLCGSGDEAATATEELSPPNAGSEVPSDGMIEVITPPGRTGIVFRSPGEGCEGHVVKDVRETSTLKGQVLVGDVIVAVDGEDTSTLDFNKIAELLMSKQDAEKRVLTIKRTA